MQLIDTHCHLDFSVFDKDRSAVLSQAKIAGVTDYIVPGVTAAGWQQLLQLSANTEGMHPALGLHPCFMQQHSNEHIDQLAGLLATEKVCGVGEIGLDLFIADADLEQQLSFLRPQLQLAKLHTLPVILHVRKAHDQMLKELRSINLESGGVIHAFSGSEQQAAQYLKLGFKLGIGGTITYERARKLHRIVRDNPLSRFVLETDAPDMPLAGYKGEKNIPSRVAEVAEAVAQLKGVSIERVAEETTLSAQQLFKIQDKKASLQ